MLFSGAARKENIPVAESMSDNKKKIVVYPPTSNMFSIVFIIVSASKLSG